MKPHTRKLARTLGLAAALPILLLSTPSTAVAEKGDYYEGEVENFFNAEACTPYSKYKFRFYHNSKLGGSFRNIGYTQMNLGAARLPGAEQPLLFCANTGAGSGRSTKNNAASARNYHPTYKGHVFFNAGWKGAVDITGPGTYFNKLTHTYNNNASFAWRS
ncbi:hypothetical protein [Streptomyces sp. NPDC054863]